MMAGLGTSLEGFIPRSLAKSVKDKDLTPIYYSVRVPLILSGPGIPSQQRTDAFCFLYDIFPTLCPLTNLPAPDSVEGRSLCPAIEDPQTPIRDVLHFAYKDVQRGVRKGRHKLIDYAVGGTRTTQLFDLDSDPLELNDLADDPEYRDLVAGMREELHRWRTELGDTQEMGVRFWEVPSDVR